MSRYSAFAIVALLATLFVVGQSSVESFQTNVNVTVDGEAVENERLTQAGLGFRKALVTYLDINLGGSAVKAALFVESFGFRSAVTSTGTVVAVADAQVDVLAIGDGVPFSLSVNFDEVIYGVSKPGNLSFTAAGAANLIAHWPILIVEIDASGAEVAVYNISDLAWAYAGLIGSDPTLIGASGVTAFLSLDGGFTTNGQITLSARTGAHVGVSNYARSEVIPKVWSFVVELANYVYGTTGNSLRIVYGTAAGSAAVVVDGSITHLPGEAKQVYADIAHEVSNAVSAGADGSANTNNVTVVAWVDAPIIDLPHPPKVAAVFIEVFGASWSVYVSNVTLPAGLAVPTSSNPVAQHTTTVGTGTRLSEASKASVPSPPSPSSSASNLFFSSLAMLAAIIAALL